MIKIRITGLPDEIECFLTELREHFFVLKESNVYKDSNSKYSRKYINVEEKDNDEKL